MQIYWFSSVIFLQVAVVAAKALDDVVVQKFYALCIFVIDKCNFSCSPSLLFCIVQLFVILSSTVRRKNRFMVSLMAYFG